jgi:hypothetical protein
MSAPFGFAAGRLNGVLGRHKSRSENNHLPCPFKGTSRCHGARKSFAAVFVRSTWAIKSCASDLTPGLVVGVFAILQKVSRGEDALAEFFVNLIDGGIEPI